MGSGDSKRKMPHRPELKTIQANGVDPLPLNGSLYGKEQPVTTPSSSSLVDKCPSSTSDVKSHQRTNQVVALLLKAVQEQRIMQKFQPVGEKMNSKVVRAQTSSLTRSVTQILEKVNEEQPETVAPPPLVKVEPPVETRQTRRASAALHLDVRNSPTDSSCESTPSTVPAAVAMVTAASPARKRARKCGPLACLNEPSIHDTLNLYLLPEATRVAATTALDLCAIRTATTSSRRHRAPVLAYTPPQDMPPSSSSAVTSVLSVSIPPAVVHQRLHEDPEVQVSSRIYSSSGPVAPAKQEDRGRQADPIMSDLPYYLPNFLLEEESLDCTLRGAQRQSEIEVPMWRCVKLGGSTHPSVDRSNGELIEPLDDEVFAQRHAKGESIEIRRERKERQHLKGIAVREKWEHKQSQLQAKLRLLTFGIHEPSQPLLPSSLTVGPKRVRSVCVADRVPVMAFSSPVPVFESRDFCLPWLQTSPKSKKKHDPS